MQSFSEHLSQKDLFRGFFHSLNEPLSARLGSETVGYNRNQSFY
jgi:hypothetical protein